MIVAIGMRVVVAAAAVARGAATTGGSAATMTRIAIATVTGGTATAMTIAVAIVGATLIVEATTAEIRRGNAGTIGAATSARTAAGTTMTRIATDGTGATTIGTTTGSATGATTATGGETDAATTTTVTLSRNGSFPQQGHTPRVYKVAIVSTMPPANVTARGRAVPHASSLAAVSAFGAHTGAAAGATAGAAGAATWWYDGPSMTLHISTEAIDLSSVAAHHAIEFTTIAPVDDAQLSGLKGVFAHANLAKDNLDMTRAEPGAHDTRGGAPAWSKWPSWRRHTRPPRAPQTAFEGLGLAF